MKKNNPKESSMWVCLNWVHLQLERISRLWNGSASIWTPVQPRQQSHQTGQTKCRSRKELRLCSRRPQVSWSEGLVRVCSKEPESLGTAVVSQARWLRYKPLVSAYKCLKHGRVAALDEHGGNLILQDSKVSGKILELIEKEKNKHHAKAWIPVGSGR